MGLLADLALRGAPRQKGAVVTATNPSPRRRRRQRALGVVASIGLLLGLLPAMATAQEYPSTEDPRYSLGTGLEDAETASLGMTHTGMVGKWDTPFWNPGNIGAINYALSDLAFTRDHVIQGSYRGFQIYDVSDPANPTLRTTMLCPGGQGDLNVYGNLLFQSVEDTSARVDCQSGGVTAANRFRGVRIWDISDLDNPEQVAVIQTCRGSHTNRLVEDPNDPNTVYVYVSGTSSQRAASEFVHTPEGYVNNRCNQTSASSPNPSQWMIEVIKVPLDNPAAAEVVNEARLFQVGDVVNGLQNGPTRPTHPCADTGECAPAGTNYSPSPNTNTCHDITTYPEIGLAAGACQGNGLLIDISDPANPVRIDAVADENFSYWHSANFSNDGSKVIFTDEWGGGTSARCAPNHRTSWGANAIFTIDRSGPTPKLVFESYYKLPAAQQNSENCVAHQGNLLPVPGRDILVQAWYQGGISLVDFTDPGNPFEIAFFDRGPISPGLTLGGYWSAYWYNGKVVGSEIARGLDVLQLTPTDQLSANEIAAATQVQLDEHNAMAMRSFDWEPSFAVAGSYVDQAERKGSLSATTIKQVRQHLSQAEKLDEGPASKRAVIAQLDNAIRKAGNSDPAVAEALQELRATYN
jgi:hypothetical protein